MKTVGLARSKNEVCKRYSSGQPRKNLGGRRHISQNTFSKCEKILQKFWWNCTIRQEISRNTTLFTFRDNVEAQPTWTAVTSFSVNWPCSPLATWTCRLCVHRFRKRKICERQRGIPSNVALPDCFTEICNLFVLETSGTKANTMPEKVESAALKPFSLNAPPSHCLSIPILYLSKIEIKPMRVM